MSVRQWSPDPAAGPTGGLPARSDPIRTDPVGRASSGSVPVPFDRSVCRKSFRPLPRAVPFLALVLFLALYVTDTNWDR